MKKLLGLQSSTFVEIESYESLRAKAEQCNKVIQKLLEKNKEQKSKLQKAESDLEASYH